LQSGKGEILGGGVVAIAEDFWGGLIVTSEVDDAFGVLSNLAGVIASAA
jgi:hypothetical protein